MKYWDFFFSMKCSECAQNYVSKSNLIIFVEYMSQNITIMIIERDEILLKM